MPFTSGGGGDGSGGGRSGGWRAKRSGYAVGKLQAAQHGLRVLERANDGERRPLLKVLLMTYGRVGRRRRELLGRLLSVRPHQGLEEESTSETAHEDRTINDAGKTAADTRSTSTKPPGAREVNDGSWTHYVPDFTPQLQALLQSQLQHPPPHLTRPLLRRMAPRLEELNSWKRPMPLNRVKNQTKDWYASTLARVHPPLPTQEWCRLRDLASGAQSEPQVPRRKRVGNAGSAGDEALLFRLGELPPTDRSRDRHAITPRYMRRMWATVFAQCPIMEWDGEGGKWKVTWGEHALHGLRRRAKESVEGYHPEANPLHSLTTAIPDAVAHIHPRAPTSTPPYHNTPTNTPTMADPTKPSVTMATVDDIPAILTMIKELAAYEHAEDKVEATEESLLRTLTFAPSPASSTQPHTNPGYAKTLLLRLPS
ncbi:hypothetical protein KC343_g10293, partial [Hortaea werneckii]